jgi:hypothetical protein
LCTDYARFTFVNYKCRSISWNFIYKFYFILFCHPYLQGSVIENFKCWTLTGVDVTVNESHIFVLVVWKVCSVWKTHWTLFTLVPFKHKIKLFLSAYNYRNLFFSFQKNKEEGKKIRLDGKNLSLYVWKFKYTYSSIYIYSNWRLEHMLYSLNE